MMELDVYKAFTQPKTCKFYTGKNVLLGKNVLHGQKSCSKSVDILDYVYTTPERNNAGKIYLRLHYAVTVL